MSNLQWSVNFVLKLISSPIDKQVELLRGCRSIRYEVQGSSLFLTDITYIESTYWVPSLLNNEGGITQQQTEANHEISVESVTGRGDCLVILTLRLDPDPTSFPKDAGEDEARAPSSPSLRKRRRWTARHLSPLHWPCRDSLCPPILILSLLLSPPDPDPSCHLLE